MNLKMIGMIIAIVGVVLLLVAFILGIVIGVNSQTQTKYWNMDDPPEESDTDAYEAAGETNALLFPINTGLSAFGMGLTFIGAGLALAKDNKGNMIALIFGIVAAIILLIALVISIYMGVISHEAATIYNKDYDEIEESDGDRLEEIEETEALLTPISYWFGGFWFGSLGLGMAVLTLVLGGATAVAGRGAPAPAAAPPPPPPPPPPPGMGGGGQPQGGYGQQQGGYGQQQQQGGWQEY